jgi:hypothetical protein
LRKVQCEWIHASLWYKRCYFIENPFKFMIGFPFFIFIISYYCYRDHTIFISVH